MDKFGLYSPPAPSAIALRPRHAAAMLGISQKHLSRLTKAGEIPAAKAGRCVMYSVDGLKAWLASRLEGGIHAAH
jgi:excisionase family DNA binding protein